jgi:hypothetical protein
MPTTTITWQNLTRATVDGNGDLVNDNSGSNNCFTNASGTGDSGGRSVEGITTAQDWEFRCTLGPQSPSESGRSFVGLASSFSLNFATWQYCLHVSTENNTSGTPHPENSIFVYEGGTPNKTYADGVWTNSGQLLRFICRNGVVRYYLDCLYLYTSPTAPTYPLYAVASMACYNSKTVDAEFITGPSVGSGIGGMTQGSQTGDACSPAWAIPSPTALPQPPTAGAPRPVRFQEMSAAWGNHGQTFGDMSSAHNTIQTARVRRFEIEWDGLSEAEAATLDAHYDSTSGGLAFSITNPHTAETVTGCRYLSYTQSPLVRKWSQRRSAVVIKFTN